MPVANTSDFHWKPKETLPPGALAANVYGDPQRGNYAFSGRFPDKYTVPLHWHTNDCMVVIMKGSMTITRENTGPVDIKEGGFFMLPARMRYTAQTPTERVFLVWGTSRFDIHYVNPKHDPRNR
jgi:mannose-6-phosphate isomerase-like protein (cupin superfamily)